MTSSVLRISIRTRTSNPGRTGAYLGAQTHP